MNIADWITIAVIFGIPVLGGLIAAALDRWVGP